MAQPSKAKAIEHLQEALNKIPELKELSNDLSKFDEWYEDTKADIANTFGEGSVDVSKFENIFSYSTVILSGSTDLEIKRKSEIQIKEGLDSAKTIIGSMIRKIKKYWEEDEPQAKTLDKSVKTSEDEKKIFIVHGHDEATQKAVAGFLQQLKLKPIILHEQPNEGHTIIEKFENYTADVGFAVVLLTPDDVGAPKDRRDDLEPRARQNVVFELGFFIGKLGRSRVCALKGTVETPSDYDGVVYTELDDADGWKMKLFLELKAAGFDVDANRMFKGP